MSNQDPGDEAPKKEVSFSRPRRTRRARRALRVPVDEVPRRSASDPVEASTEAAAAPVDVPPPARVPSGVPPGESSGPASPPPGPPPSPSYPPPAGQGVLMRGTVRVSDVPPGPADSVEVDVELDDVESSPAGASADAVEVEVDEEDLGGAELTGEVGEEGLGGAELTGDLEGEELDEDDVDADEVGDTLPGEPAVADGDAEWLEDAATDVRDKDERRPTQEEAASPSASAEPTGTPEPSGEAEELDIEEVEEGDEDALELQEVEAPTPPKPPSKPPPAPQASPAADGAAGAEPPPVPEEEGRNKTPGPSEPEVTSEAAARESQSSADVARNKRRPWFEEFFNDDYLRTVPVPTEQWVSRQCDFIEQTLGLERGATILDAGCGLGLHAVELASRGYLIVGLDLSLPMLSRAADEAQDRGLKMNFLHADMREMSFDGAFDAVLCWGTTFGYFDDDTNREVIERLYRALKPMGLLLLDVVNRDHVLPAQPNLIWFEGDGCVCMEETQFNYITSRLAVKRTVILDDGRQRESHYSIRLYSLHELGQLLHQKGFRVAQVSGLEATPGVFLGSDSPRMIILAERRLQSAEASTPPGEGPDGGEE